MGPTEVNEFLTLLAVKLNIAAATHNQAVTALIFLKIKVLERMEYTSVAWAVP